MKLGILFSLVVLSSFLFVPACLNTDQHRESQTESDWMTSISLDVLLSGNGFEEVEVGGEVDFPSNVDISDLSEDLLEQCRAFAFTAAGDVCEILNGTIVIHPHGYVITYEDCDGEAWTLASIIN